MMDKSDKTRKTRWAFRVVIFLGLGLLLGASIFQIFYQGYHVKWQQIDLVNKNVQPIDSYTRSDTRTSCEHAWLAFSPFSNPPSQIAQCTQYEGNDHGLSYTYRFAIDENHNYWFWYHATPDKATSFITFLIFSSIGGLVGLTFGSVTAVINKRQKLSVNF